MEEWEVGGGDSRRGGLPQGLGEGVRARDQSLGRNVFYFVRWEVLDSLRSLIGVNCCIRRGRACGDSGA